MTGLSELEEETELIAFRIDGRGNLRVVAPTWLQCPECPDGTVVSYGGSLHKCESCGWQL